MNSVREQSPTEVAAGCRGMFRYHEVAPDMTAIEFRVEAASGGVFAVTTKDPWVLREALGVIGAQRAGEREFMVMNGCSRAELAMLAARLTGDAPVLLSARELHVLYRGLVRVGTEPRSERLVHESTGLFRYEVAEIAAELIGAIAAGAS